jgi:CRP/FNR family transcriptional regulator, nitrogen oxide reductase regulator
MTAGNAERSRTFDGLDADARRECLALARLMEVRRGQWVARQGEPASTFCLVDEGTLKILQTSVDGRDLVVRFAGPGDPFGGVVVLESAPYPVSAVAVEPARLYAWNGDGLRRMLEQWPPVRANLMREMTAHMTDALTRVRELTTLRVGPRVALTLLRLARHAGRRTPEGVLIPHPLTRQELADLVGATLFTVSRTLAGWQADGILESRKRHLLIVAPARLEALAGGAESADA